MTSMGRKPACPGEARETDIGFTGGGNNTHQVYVAGVPHHRLKDQNVVDHLVELVEKKAAEIEAEKRVTADAAAS
jgi:(E)-4-hydroxy-3-methylbut-2-enyl-diphosphate synthase